MPANQMEAWSSGEIRIEVDGGHRPIVAVVELVRISRLVHVIGRADSDDPAFREMLPQVLSAVEVYPLLSVARDPLVELGAHVARVFAEGVAASVRDKLASAPAPPS